MNKRAQQLFDTVLTEDERRELRLIIEKDPQIKGFKKTANVAVFNKRFSDMLRIERMISDREDELFQAYEIVKSRQGVSLPEVYKQVGNEDKDRFSTLANKSMMLINLLDNAYQDMTSVMERNGYHPETIERMANAGKKMADEMKRLFGGLPEEFADDFDDACSKVDVLIDNKVRAFLRQQQKKQFTNKQKTNNYERD